MGIIIKDEIKKGNIMIDHITMQVSDLKKAKEFYEKVLNEIGIKIVVEHENAICFGQVWMVEGNPNKFHLAFTVNSEEEVNNFYKKALELGATDNGAPGIREHYAPNYYACFFHDFDGNNIEAVYHE